MSLEDGNDPQIDDAMLGRTYPIQTVIGVTDSPEAVAIYPNGDMRWNDPVGLGMTFWLYDRARAVPLDGTDESGASVCDVRQSLAEGYLPVVRTEASYKGLVLEIVAFTAALGSRAGNYCWGSLQPVMCLVTVRNESPQRFSGAFGAGFQTRRELPPTFVTGDRDLHSFGLAPLPYKNYHQVRYVMAMSPAPRTPACIHLRDVAARERFSVPVVIYEEDLGAQGLVPSLDLAGGEEFHCELIFVRSTGYLADIHQGLKLIDVPGLLETTVNDWKHRLTEGAEVSLGDPDVADLYKASVAYVLMSRTKGTPRAGNSIYTDFWVRDGAYWIHAMDIAGLHHEARIAVDNMLAQQDEEGLFLNDTYSTIEWDCQGQALWAATQHYELSGDLDWLKSVYPRICKGVEWLSAARESTKADADAYHFGLLPPSFGEGLSNRVDYHYYDNFFALLGLAGAARAAGTLGRRQDAERFDHEHADLRQCVLGSIERVCERDGIEYIPCSPYQTQPYDYITRGLSLLVYPCRILEPTDPRVTSTLQLAEETLVQDGLVIHGWPLTPEPMTWPGLTAEYGIVHVLRGERAKAFEILKTLVACASPNRCWPEMFCHDGSRSGDMPISWASSNFILLLRHMLITEDPQAETLVLAPAVPLQWLEQGRPVAVTKCPTLYGPVSYSLSMDAGGNCLHLQVRAAQPERFRHFRLALPVELAGSIGSVKVDGKDQPAHGEAGVDFPSAGRDVEIRW